MTIQEYLIKLCYFMGLEEDEIEVKSDEGESRVEILLNIPKEKESLFIGSRGQGLRAIRSILNTTFFEELEGKRLVFDINNYLKEKEQLLIDQAIEVVNTVAETGQPQTLYDLNSYERYLIHSAIAENKEFEKVGSYSTSVGPHRYLTICLKEDLPENEENS